MGRIAQCVAAAAALLQSAAAADFPQTLRGEWAGVYCGSDSTRWWFEPNLSSAYAREYWCNGLTCGDVDHRFTNINVKERVIEMTPVYAPGFSLTGYKILMQLSENGQVIEGGFQNHPRCRGIRLTKVTSVMNVRPLSASSPAPMPAAVHWPECAGEDNDRAVAACTAIISSGVSGESLAVAYSNRATAYNSKVLFKFEFGDEGLRLMTLAIADYERAASLSPTDARRKSLAAAYGFRAFLKETSEDWGGAVADYSRAIAISPSATDYRGRGHSNYRLGANGDAISDLTRSIELDPNEPQARSYRGHAYLTIGKFQEAVVDFTLGIAASESSKIAFQPLLVQLYYERGLARRASRDRGGDEDILKARSMDADALFRVLPFNYPIATPAE